MNVNDTDIVRRLMNDAGWYESSEEDTADVVLTNTCAIREGAERKVWTRLHQLKKQDKVVGVLGCMAERLQSDLLQDGLAQVVVGPDEYRSLPRLLNQQMNQEGTPEPAIAVELSPDETYADVAPIRNTKDPTSAFVSIQRGCSNHCAFCIVPFTRGQERSRPMESIVQEVEQLVQEQGIKEVTLLGQNVNSYHYQPSTDISTTNTNTTGYQLSNSGFRSRIRRSDQGFFFADLLAAVSDISPELRVRFTSPHPKDYPHYLLELMAERANICNQLHMPAQSGSTSMLKRMKRGYSREAYLELIASVREYIPDVALSSDFIAGFCGETEEEHADTVSLMEQVRFDQAFMFAYSLREQTHAAKRLQDDVPPEIKQQRLQEIIDTFQRKVHDKNADEVGRLRLVLVQGPSHKSPGDETWWNGKTDQNKRIHFPIDNGCFEHSQVLAPGPLVDPTSQVAVGDYAVVEVTEAKGTSLRGRLMWRTTLQVFAESGLDGMDHKTQERAKRLSMSLHEALTRTEQAA